MVGGRVSNGGESSTLRTRGEHAKNIARQGAPRSLSWGDNNGNNFNLLRWSGPGYSWPGCPLGASTKPGNARTIALGGFKPSTKKYHARIPRAGNLATMTLRKTSYCQGCIRTDVTLKLTDAGGRPYWLCERCLNPLPRKAYEQGRADSRKNWKKDKPQRADKKEM